MLFSCQALVLAALALEGVAASPAHRHLHQHAHKRDLVDVLEKRGDSKFDNPALYKDVDWTDMNWKEIFAAKGQSASAPPSTPTDTTPDKKIAVQPSPQETAPPASESSTTPSTKPDTSESSSSGSSGSCIDISVVWSKGDPSLAGGAAANAGGNGWTDASTSSISKVKRATPAQDGAMGNNGGGQYGRNIVPLSDCNSVGDHKYTIKFTNSYAGGKDMGVALWDKNGPDGQPQSGAFQAAPFYFDLPAGKSAMFAFEPASMIAFAELSSTCQRGGPANGIQAPWGEANFEPPETNGASMSAWDVSMMYDQGADGSLSLSDGTPDGASSVKKCGFVSTGQTSTGDGCKTNINRGDPVHLTASFGSD